MLPKGALEYHAGGECFAPLRYSLGTRMRVGPHAAIRNKNDFELKFIETPTFKLARYIFVVDFKLSSFDLSRSHLGL